MFPFVRAGSVVSPVRILRQAALVLGVFSLPLAGLSAAPLQEEAADSESGRPPPTTLENAAGYLGDDCEPGSGEASVRVHVSNITEAEGNIRVQIYGPDPDDFLAKGAKLIRVDVPAEDHDQTVCVPLPKAGEQALVVLHDRNANGKADFFSEGFGFSRNPELGLGKPDFDKVVFTAEPGVQDMDVRLTYMFGSDAPEKKKRRRLRRR
ncbi:DUF2141 domain-containing protein [Yunchengibacter salinarum]|uniref:DUF2141 domain-containing protein n=1 Tax=Yunchengibacter salinarum TaxID=3133399 RepID=UPI0035B5E249